MAFLKGRIFNISQGAVHPDTGEPLLNEAQIKNGLNHKSIRRWAYAPHDEDEYLEEDVKKNPRAVLGALKPLHWHIVIQTYSPVSVTSISKWFGIPENFIDVPKGTGAFLDCVEYLTHEDEKQQDLGKHCYPDEIVRSNFDFRAELTKRAERELRYGRDLTEKEAVRNEVLFHGMTLRKVATDYPLLYQNDFATLDKMRLRYLSKFAPMPKTRINYYIEGSSSVGKSAFSRGLARTLIDPEHTMKDDEIFYIVGDSKVTFEGYDGQPVIIWDDCRADTLLRKLGSFENALNVFDLFPPDIQQNVKYSSIRLTNTINIVNSIQPWSEFLDGLVGLVGSDRTMYNNTALMGYSAPDVREDPKQSRRRFPFFVVLHENDYTLGINKGIYNESNEFDEYIAFKGFSGSVKEIVKRCGDNEKLVSIATDSLMSPIKEKHTEVSEKLVHHQEADDETLLAEFANYGKQDPNNTTPEVVNGRVLMSTHDRPITAPLSNTNFTIEESKGFPDFSCGTTSIEGK